MSAPFFSICIPQYNRTDFLIAACRSFASQTFKDFEVCISDDCSNDGKEQDLIAYLQASGMRHKYRRNEKNLRYDGNLRSAIELSTGRYLVLMGNDDGLAGPDVLERLRQEIQRTGDIAVAITNYREMPTGRRYDRMSKTGVLGAGPECAAAMFRNYSFVSGIVLDGPGARALASPIVDGSEMYQMYLGTRLVAAGGRFLSVAEVMIDKDLQIEGQDVESYRARPRLDPCPIVKRPLPMGRLLEVVAQGLRPHTSPAELDRLLFSVGRELYSYTYPFWGIEYRRVQSWRYALGVIWGFSPAEVAARQGLSRVRFALLWLIYAATSSAALLAPIALFDTLRPRLYELAKRQR